METWLAFRENSNHHRSEMSKSVVNKHVVNEIIVKVSANHLNITIFAIQKNMYEGYKS